MTISELGSIGELLAAIATIATLIYLALQIRANTIVTKAESQRGAAALRMEALKIPASSLEISETFTTGLVTPNELSPGQRTQFYFQFSTIVYVAESSYFDYELGLIDLETFESSSSLAFKLLPTPGGKDYWKHYSDSHIPTFREYLKREGKI